MHPPKCQFLSLPRLGARVNQPRLEGHPEILKDPWTCTWLWVGTEAVIGTEYGAARTEYLLLLTCQLALGMERVMEGISVMPTMP